MQSSPDANFDWGVFSPVFYAVSSVWMVVSQVDANNPGTTLLATFIGTIPGILLGIGTIVQTISLVQHRRDKLRQERYLRELELKIKP